MNELIRIVEGTIFASKVPVSPQDIAKLFEEDEKPALADIRKAIELLQKGYEKRGIRLVEVASGFRFQVAENVAPYICKSIEDKPARYSRALLETLALIAYRQPITRGEIEDIRGVVVSTNIIKTLDEQEWIRVVGYKDVPGKPALYATTKVFLDHFGLKNLEELPPLAELRAIETVDLADEASQDLPIEENALAASADENALETTQEESLPASAEEIANAAIAAAMQAVKADENPEEDLEIDDELEEEPDSELDIINAALADLQLSEDDIKAHDQVTLEDEEVLDEQAMLDEGTKESNVNDMDDDIDDDEIGAQTMSSILDEIDNARDDEEEDILSYEQS
ncbi:SMC-Scp complex subunit ScpB [Candidatus Berkiella aquae]|nr:SMC-Scp complex subunit ScpB [Candidatus Berkiella aquae]